MAIFTGIKVLDLTKVFSGPFATRMLADYGAEVIKIESPQNPDDSRHYPPLKNNHSGYYEILNRNKYGITLDLREKDDLEKFYALVKDADVVVENLTPQTKHKLKVDYETLMKYNPTLIYASLSGYGQTYNTKYYDVIAQAESGLMSLSGTPDNPTKIGPSVVDAFSGLMLAFGISSALLYKEKSGKGQYIDVSMLSSAMNLLESNLIGYSVTGQNPVRSGNSDNLIAPFGSFKAQNGFVVIAIGNNQQWKIFATHFNIHNELFATNQLRVDNIQLLQTTIEKVLEEYSVGRIIEILNAKGIACARVQEMSEVASNPVLYKNHGLTKIHHPNLGECVIPHRSIVFSEDKAPHNTVAPEVGEHNDRYGV